MLFFVKQKTAYEMRISDWSSDVCSSDLRRRSVRTPSSSPLPSLVPCAFPPIMAVRTLFATHFYEADIGDPDLLEDLEQSCRLLDVEDGAGRGWRRAPGHPGYTDSASLGDLPHRHHAIAAPKRRLDQNGSAAATERV